MATQPHTRPLHSVPDLGFGDKLRRLRLELGMDQREFADEIGVNHATLSRYELSARAPRSALLVASAVQLRYGSADVDLWGWLLNECPRQDSNLQPAVYTSAQVIDLGAERARRRPVRRLARRLEAVPA